MASTFAEAEGVALGDPSIQAGSQVQIDGVSYGKTPVDVRLPPGQHILGLQHPDTLEDVEPLTVPETGTNHGYCPTSMPVPRYRPCVILALSQAGL